jgi:hypothetical protein
MYKNSRADLRQRQQPHPEERRQALCPTTEDSRPETVESPAPAEGELRHLTESIRELNERQVRMEDMLKVLVEQRTVKAWYSTEEVAKIMGRSKFTVREWCRHRQVNAKKQGSGRGKHQAWVISHDELLRVQRDGLLRAEHGLDRRLLG